MQTCIRKRKQIWPDRRGNTSNCLEDGDADDVTAFPDRTLTLEIVMNLKSLTDILSIIENQYQ